MRIANMAETVLRTSLRAPNIAQLSPTPSLSVSNTSITISNTSYPSGTQPLESPASSSHSPGNSTQAAAAQRLQLLKQRKTDLEKILLEKNSLLQQLCRQEAQIIGCYDFESTDGKSSTLRRKVNTAFKLPENLLNGTTDKEDEINKLLLGKQIQQQISEASLKMANDASQTKSIRRTHKNNYEAAQQKLTSINQSLTALKKRQNCDVTSTAYQNQFKQASPILKNVSDSKYATNNNNFLHPTSQASPTQFNNNFIGSAVNSHQLLMKAYSGNISPNINNNNHHSMMQRRNSLISNTSSTNLDVMPTTPTSSRHHRQETVTAPYDFAGYHHVHHNASASNNNKADFSIPDTSTSPHKLKKTALLDNDYNLQRYSPISCETDTFNYHNHYNQYSPGDIITTVSPEFRSSPQMSRLMLSGQHVNQPRQLPMNHRLDNAPHTQPMMIQAQRHPYNQRLDVVVDDSAMTDQLNGRLISPPITSKGTLMVHQGLGGYWMTLDNNERVWCSVDRFASLDRKGQSLKLRKQAPVTLQKQPTISTSLGNIEHISKLNIDENADSLSISSMNSEQKKFKERAWIETSLDCPPPRPIDERQRKLMTPSPPPPVLHQREKKKLSSHSMHSPGRNNYLYASPSNSFYNEKQLQQQIGHSALDRNFSNSALTLAPAAKLVTHKPSDFHHQTKPLPIPPKQPYPLPSAATTASVSHPNQHRVTQQQQPTSPSRPPPQQMQKQLRRTASSASSTSTNLLINPTNIEVESPKNMTVVHPAKFQPYKEESKPFEMSDFYKYSTKFRQKNNGNDVAADP
ncbi:dual specificity protein kinase splA isoform X1 [Bradysia coprophila]|uniref:dual specificity protein kinase splA isoform X1 n=1 Tax=Bradysia coprophila TaxID=38358 RepID=UPI00187DB81A|nr:dual specificity protein kinase splA isoform X1 [Bradysia coprophila]